MTGLLAQKIGMTRLFRDDGTTVPVTVVRVKPNVITQVKTKDNDGYDAVVLSVIKERKDGKHRQVFAGEFKISADEAVNFQKGQSITVADFKDVTEALRVTGVSKGKGFQGVMKRHNFSGLPASHGHQYHRTQGSVGTRKPRRVKKGKKMAGHMGCDQITLRNVPIEKIDMEENILALRGPLPGAINSYLKLELITAAK